MDRSLLVRLFVPTLGAKGGPRGTTGKCGTGYPVSKAHILTARHVVRCEGRDSAYPIKALWVQYPKAGPCKGWFKVTKIVWEDEALDAALIECPRPPDAQGVGSLLSSPPQDGVPWVGCGFPRVAKWGDKRTPASFGGVTYRLLPGQDRFEIEVRVAPTDDNLWAGVSGTPACQENSRIIIGLVREVAPNLRSQKLFATPASALLRVPEVRSLLGYDDASRRSQMVKVKTDLNRLFGQSEKLRTVLASEWPVCDERVPATPPELTEALLKLKVDAALSWFWFTFEALQEERNYAEDVVRKAIDDAFALLRQAAELVAPYLFDDTAVAEVREYRISGLTTLLEVPCAKETVAEIIMAAVDNRPAKLRPRQDSSHYPAGKLAIASLPELGIVGPGQIADAMREEVTRKLNWRDVQERIDDAIFRHFLGSGSRPGVTREEMVGLAANEMMIEKEKRTYYVLCRLPQDEESRQLLRSGVAALRQDYPNLMVLCLAGDTKVERDEIAIFGRFQRLLPLAPGTGGS